MVATVKNKKKTEVDPVPLVIDDMLEHVERLRWYVRYLGPEVKPAYLFEVDGLGIDAQVLAGLIVGKE